MFRPPQTPLTEMSAKRIALIKPSALGDIVHTLPVLDALRQRFPDAHITWVVNRAYEPLLIGHPALDETLAVDRQAAKKGVRTALATTWNLFRATCASSASIWSSICKGCCVPAS